MISVQFKCIPDGKHWWSFDYALGAGDGCRKITLCTQVENVITSPLKQYR